MIYYVNALTFWKRR